MAHIIAISTHKGGAGKTVTALALAAGLASTGERCLLIDLDPQGHSSIGIGIDRFEPTIKDFFERHPALPLEAVLQPAPTRENLDVAPCDLRLAWIAEALSGRPKKEELLRRGLRSLEPRYGWIVIDTPPSLGSMTQNALAAADFVVIPTQADARAANAIADLLELVQLIKGDAFDRYGILRTRVDAHKTRTNAAVVAALERWKQRLFQTVIPVSEPLNQAQMARRDIFDFAPKSTGALAYLELIHELQQP
jgi:chromosome partitioning protein